MTKRQYFLIVGTIFWLAYRQERIRHKQRLQFEIICNIRDTLEATSEFMDTIVQQDIDEEFVEIVEENLGDLHDGD